MHVPRIEPRYFRMRGGKFKFYAKDTTDLTVNLEVVFFLEVDIENTKDKELTVYSIAPFFMYR